jgi:hypothetical protein
MVLGSGLRIVRLERRGRQLDAPAESDSIGRNN